MINKIDNQVSFLRRNKHPDGIYLPNKLTLLRDSKMKISLVNVHPADITNNIDLILDMSERYNIDLTATMDNRAAYNQKIHLIDFVIEQQTFCWNYDMNI